MKMLHGARLAVMKALLSPSPVLATESLELFEKLFDQLVLNLKVNDMLEMILVRDFAITSWELARYSRHRTVAFDRKFKDTLEFQVQQLKERWVRREARAARLADHAGQRPTDVGTLMRLDETGLEGAIPEMDEIMRRTPTELSYNLALEKSIGFHKDLEVLITSITKRRDQALEMLDRYRQGFGKRAEAVMEEILDAEYNVVDQLAPPIVPDAVATGQTAKIAAPPAEGGAPSVPAEPVSNPNEVCDGSAT